METLMKQIESLESLAGDLEKAESFNLAVEAATVELRHRLNRARTEEARMQTIRRQIIGG